LVSKIARKVLKLIKSSLFNLKEVLKNGGLGIYDVEKTYYDE
jgi:hypothetical protein